jgi:hypothetical protein
MRFSLSAARLNKFEFKGVSIMKCRSRVVLLFSGLAMICGVCGAGLAQAAQTLEVSGRVIKVTPESIIIRKLEEDHSVIELSRRQTGPTEALPKPGDVVTVWYTLSAKKMKIEKSKSGQQAGQAAPGKGPEKVPVLDDRAFYRA